MGKTNVLSAFLCTFLFLIVNVFSATDAEARPNNANKKSTTSQTKKDDCPSGITSSYGQCWVCDKSLHPKYKQAVKDSKNTVRGLGGCKSQMNKDQLSEREKAWNKLWQDRKNENRCWKPSHDNHILEENSAKKNFNECQNLLKGK